MRKHKPHIKPLTDEMYASIPLMIAKGMDRKQIAEHFGTNWQSLQVLCCKRSISLRRRDRPKLQRLPMPDVPINLQSHDRRKLHDKAKALGMNEVRLAAKLLHVIIRDDLFVAVLDPDKPEQANGHAKN